jgi:hypothetical protein
LRVEPALLRADERSLTALCLGAILTLDKRAYL